MISENKSEYRKKQNRFAEEHMNVRRVDRWIEEWDDRWVIDKDGQLTFRDEVSVVDSTANEPLFSAEE